MRTFILTLLISFSSIGILAQEQNLQRALAVGNDPYAELAKDPDNYENLKILYNKVTPFSGLFTFNDDDNNLSNAKHFKQALSELYHIDNNTTFLEDDLGTKKVILANKNLDKLENTVEVGIINTDIAYLNYDEDNPQNGGLDLVNGVYHRINNQPPIIRKHISIISPLSINGSKINNQIKYVFSNENIYHNTGKRIKTLKADLGNGDIQTIISNYSIITPEVLVNYQENDSIAILGFELLYADGTSNKTFSAIQLHHHYGGFESLRTPSNLLYWESDIPDSGTNAKGQLSYRVFYGKDNSTKVLRKPFLIIDGFDPSDTRKIILEDCNYECRKKINNFSENEYVSIAKLMSYRDENNNLVSLLDQLEELNYDVIIIDFPAYINNLNETIVGGADDIFRNGRTVASFIKEINRQLKRNGSTEKLVVVGPSMGGQITRYALAYMEKKQQETGDGEWNHNTRLWLSMDSPHQGANIPLAVQADLYFLGDLLGKVEAKEKYDDQINSTAAKQMLIEMQKPGIDNPRNQFHHDYIGKLKANGINNSDGYPVMNGIRKIAITNGSISGGKNVSPTKHFYEIAAFAKVQLPLPFMGGVRVAKVGAFKLKNWYRGDKHISVGDGGVGFEDKVLDGFARSPKTNWIYKPTHDDREINKYSLDAVPGGYFNSAEELKQEVKGNLEGPLLPKDRMKCKKVFGVNVCVDLRGWISHKLIVEQRIPRGNRLIAPQTFIPVHSALDTKDYKNWYTPVDLNAVCENKTPFDNFYGENNNMEHVSFTPKMIDWLLNELETNSKGIQFNPCLGNKIKGDEIILDLSNHTYEILNFHSGTQVEWVLPNNLIKVNAFGNRITLKQNPSSNISEKQAIIKAYLKNGNSVYILEKVVSLGLKPVIDDISINMTPVLCTNLYSNGGQLDWTRNLAFIDLYSLNNIEFPVIFEWKKIEGFDIIDNSGQGEMSSVLFKPTMGIQNQTYKRVSTQVRARNQYGWSEWSMPLYASLKDCSHGYYSVYPNPAHDVLNISFTESETHKNLRTFSIKTLDKKFNKYIIKIYNTAGIEVRSLMGGQKEIKVPLNGLLPGNYFLHIIKDGKTHIENLMIK